MILILIFDIDSNTVLQYTTQQSLSRPRAATESKEYSRIQRDERFKRRSDRVNNQVKAGLQFQ